MNGHSLAAFITKTFGINYRITPSGGPIDWDVVDDYVRRLMLEEGEITKLTVQVSVFLDDANMIAAYFDSGCGIFCDAFWRDIALYKSYHVLTVVLAHKCMLTCPESFCDNLFEVSPKRRCWEVGEDWEAEMIRTEQCIRILFGSGVVLPEGYPMTSLVQRLKYKATSQYYRDLIDISVGNPLQLD